MAELDPAKIGQSLTIDEKYYNTLDIEGFSHMMKDPSYCYKFYWLEAIVHLISEGVSETTFDEVINEMICNAWYSVREFHIHLSGIQADGQVRDGLERAVLTLSDLSDLPSNASRIEIKNAIHALKELNCEIEDIKNFNLAGTDNERNVLIIRKIKETNKKYPRKAGTPSKMPL